MFIFKKKKVNEDKVFPDDSSSTKSERKKAPFAALPTTRLISERLLNAVVDKTTITAATLSRPNTDYQPDFLNSSKSYVLSNNSSQTVTDRHEAQDAAVGTDDTEGAFVSQLHPAQDTHIASCSEPTENEQSISQSNHIGVSDASTQVTEPNSCSSPDDPCQKLDHVPDLPPATAEETVSTSPPRTSTETVTDSGFYDNEEAAADRGASVYPPDKIEDELECFTYFVQLCETEPSEDETVHADITSSNQSRTSEKRKSQSFIPRRSLPPPPPPPPLANYVNSSKVDSGNHQDYRTQIQPVRKRHSASERELSSPRNKPKAAQRKRSSLPIPTAKTGTLHADTHCVKLKARAVCTGLDTKRTTRLPVHRPHLSRASSSKTYTAETLAAMKRDGCTKLPVPVSGQLNRSSIC